MVDVRLGNGQCAHRWVGHGRCLELATTVRLTPVTTNDASRGVVYYIPLCGDHARFFDRHTNLPV